MCTSLMLKRAGQQSRGLVLQEERATREATETQLATAMHEAEEATASAQQQATQQLADEVSPTSFCPSALSAEHISTCTAVLLLLAQLKGQSRRTSLWVGPVQGWIPT